MATGTYEIYDEWDGGGSWLADNSNFKNENEPFDAYGTEWEWGIGKMSMQEESFVAVKDGNEDATFWEYLVFWNPNEKKAVFQQFGGGGIVGVGEIKAEKV